MTLAPRSRMSACTGRKCQGLCRIVGVPATRHRGHSLAGLLITAAATYACVSSGSGCGAQNLGVRGGSVYLRVRKWAAGDVGRGLAACGGVRQVDVSDTRQRHCSLIVKICRIFIQLHGRIFSRCWVSLVWGYVERCGSARCGMGRRDAVPRSRG